MVTKEVEAESTCSSPQLRHLADLLKTKLIIQWNLSWCEVWKWRNTEDASQWVHTRCGRDCDSQLASQRGKSNNVWAINNQNPSTTRELNKLRNGQPYRVHTGDQRDCTTDSHRTPTTEVHPMKNRQAKQITLRHRKKQKESPIMGRQRENPNWKERRYPQKKC